ncbi:MAG: hypothetical protein AUJ76_04385 [Candidatus Omnitrophica bacterium CG1_02_41_171]|nr:MAG: hypothetical protein AUJ76_04385 [Candidatus Omnitrophica bacterium CG1_02_41_171]
MEDYQEGYLQIKEVLAEEFNSLRLSVIKNLSCLIIALVMLLRTHRGWYGRFSLSGMARAMATEGGPKSRYKRLSRFLDNSQFKMADLSSSLIRLAKGVDISTLLPLIVDQVTIADIQVITGSYPTEDRAIPVAMTTFEYGKIEKSQNSIEETFLLRLAACLPEEVGVVWIMDRGYARCSLLKTCRKKNWLFIIRGRREVIVEYKENGKICRKSLGRLKHRQGKAIRYSGVFYQEIGREKIDIIVYREKGFKEPWFLLVPANSEDILPTELVVEWYRARMNIEVNFRDFKSHLGVRGLSLKVRKAERLDRLLAVMVLAYILLLVLGVSSIGKRLRKEVEIVRRTARHGTKRTLSVLSIALMAITDTFLLNRTNLIKVLVDCLRSLTQNLSVPCLSG